MDNSGLEGALKDLFLPEHLVAASLFGLWGFGFRVWVKRVPKTDLGFEGTQRGPQFGKP